MAGATSTLEQLFTAMRLIVPTAEFERLSGFIRDEALTQVLNVIDQRVKQLTEAELTNFFSQLSDTLLMPTHPQFEKIRAFCVEAGIRATHVAFDEVNVVTLTKLLVLQSSFRHFSKYLTSECFSGLGSKLEDLDPNVVVTTKAYVSHTPTLYNNFTQFTKAAGS